MAAAEQRADDDELGAAIRFWHLGLPSGPQHLRAIAGDVPIVDLVAAGLIVERGEGWAPAVAISPFERLLIAHDSDDGSGMAPDHVLGVGAATLTLAALTPRREVGRVLDIGTGSGAQALLARGHAESVVATDVSERAAWMAAISAALSGVDGVEIRVGDGLAPIGREMFDLIVCNPPFVISPDRDLVFRDGEARADGLSRDLVRNSVPHLERGGTACILVNWIVEAGADEGDVPRAWVADLDCDALILHHDSLDPLTYAERWTMVPDVATVGDQRDALERWSSHLDGLGAASVASGAIVLRRTGRAARSRYVEMPKRPLNGGEHVERMLASIDRFSGADDPALDAAVFGLVHGHRVEQRLSYGHGSYQAADVVLRLDRSAGVIATMPADLLEVLFGIDGERTLAGVMAEVATSRGTSEAVLRADAAPVLLNLYELGFLTLAESAD